MLDLYYGSHKSPEFLVSSVAYTRLRNRDSANEVSLAELAQGRSPSGGLGGLGLPGSRCSAVCQVVSAKLLTASRASDLVVPAEPMILVKTGRETFQHLGTVSVSAGELPPAVAKLEVEIRVEPTDTCLRFLHHPLSGFHSRQNSPLLRDWLRPGSGRFKQAG